MRPSSEQEVATRCCTGVPFLRHGERMPSIRHRWWLYALWAVASVSIAAAREFPCPPPGSTAATEACVRAELGVPPGATRVAILSQSSHLDWDWRHTFEEYFSGPLADPLLFLYPGAVDTVFSDAVGLLSSFHDAGTRYYYSVAEMGFLQRFVEAHPDAPGSLGRVGQDLRIVGGGVTSPDSLLPSGEAFIRDYLVGKTWLDATLGLPLRQAWVPDDFGHDVQLPIVLEAMGLAGVGLGRVPGVESGVQSLGFVPPTPGSLATDLLRDGIDFVWRAADGSRVLGHWMPAGYCQGDWALGASPGASSSALEKAIALDGSASTTPYIFVPVGCDFARPRPDLVDLAAAWNTGEYARTGVWAVVATFDHYVQLIAAHRAELRTRRFDPTPYWTGYYATRPLLKALHLHATQALLEAETFGAIADATRRRDPVAWRAAVQARTAAIHAGWTALVPGNHHDFITGTALDPVYEGEQLPRLADALAKGDAERARASGEIVAAIRPRTSDEAGTAVVFNPLGFARTGLTEVPGQSAAGDPGAQASAEGGRLFLARVPGLGYATEDRARRTGGRGSSVSLVVGADGTTAILENRFLRATLRQDAAWGITSLVDKRAGAELIQPGAVGNAFVPYTDDGGLYRFGDEMSGYRLEPAPATVVGGVGTVLEQGPLRARFVGATTIDGRPFTKEYQLVAGEPFLRMIATGSAAPGTSVMMHLPLAGRIDRLVHGTPYHWDRKRPERTRPLTFEATHDFLIPEFHRKPLAAIYHTAVPAWAAQRSGLVVAALWRNANQEKGDFLGAFGTDTHEVSLSYALRVPTGVHDPRSGEQLREALSFETPLTTAVGQPAGDMPRTFSLARVTPAPAIVTAAKAGTTDPDALVLRVYQPTNRPLRLVVHSQARRLFPRGARLVVDGVTALEAPLRPERAAALRVTGDPERFGFVATRALTSLAIHVPRP